MSKETFTPPPGGKTCSQAGHTCNPPLSKKMIDLIQPPEGARSALHSPSSTGQKVRGGWSLICALLVLALLSPLQCTRGHGAQHLIVISLDTTRPDHLGCYGNPWISTPHLDRLAAESILFTNYMTVVPTTLPSHTSLFTGTYPHTHGTPQNGYIVNEKNIMLTEILKEAGFHTVGIIGSFALDSRFAFSQGFDTYNEVYEKSAGTNRRTQHERPAESVTRAAVSYLEKSGIPDRLFLFAHYFDPHKPFDPPPPYDTLYYWKEDEPKRGDGIAVHYTCPHSLNEENWQASREAARLYAGEISYMDAQVGKLIDYLKRNGILDRALLVVTSDHGENFWEHLPYFHHGTATYQTTMQGVCMIRLPKAAYGGTRLAEPLSSIAIMPSLVSYLKLHVPEGIDGRAWDFANIRQTIGSRTLYGQATLTRPWKIPEAVTVWPHTNKTRCIRSGDMKFIQTPYARSEELYNLAEDPFEQNNLLLSPTPEAVAAAGELREKLERWVETARPLESCLENKRQEDTIKRLQALGYL